MRGGLQITVKIINMYIHKGFSGPGVEPEREWGATAAAKVTLYRHPAPPEVDGFFATQKTTWSGCWGSSGRCLSADP